MITVFGKEWFKKYNKQLCWVANSFIGDFVFKISKMGHDKKKYGKITEMHPNAITHKQKLIFNLKTEKIEQEFTTQFFSRNEYALRLQKVFYPIWLLFHAWDMLIANPFKPAWNLGFDTLTVYPDASPESTSVDAGARAGSQSWANARAETTAAWCNDSESLIRTGCLNGGDANSFDIYRAWLLFDTSALTASANISAGVLSQYIYEKNDTDNDGYDYISIVLTTPASNTSIVTTDFDNIGTAKQSNDIDIGNITLDVYTDFTLNATGRGNISKTSISKFGAREGHDIDNHELAISGDDKIAMRSADYGSNKPKLVVTYTTGQDYFKTCSETIAINDTLLNKTSRVFTEAISIVDSISIQKILKRTLSETITIVDNIDAKKIAVKTLSEAISMVDTIKKSIGKTLTETITIIDSIIFGKVFARTYSEIITIVDTIAMEWSKTFTDIITIADTISKKTARILSEVITIVDSIATRKILSKTLSDVITIVDTVKSKTAKTLLDVITIADSISKITAQVLLETITLAESLYIKLNGVNVKWIRKYVEKVGSFTRKYSEKTGTFIKKYFKDV